MMGDTRDLRINNLRWFIGRLDSRMRDASQAEESCKRMYPAGYPMAKTLAEIHAKAADIYFAALLEAKRELERVEQEDPEIEQLTLFRGELPAGGSSSFPLPGRQTPLVIHNRSDKQLTYRIEEGGIVFIEAST